jgi:phosphatidylinositol alpha-1,6-mannosyltransferase
LVPRSYAVWVHGNEFWNESFIRSDYIRVIRRADCVLLNSNFTANAMEMAIGPVPQACVCWLSTEDDDPPESCAVVDGPPIVLFVGRSDEYFAKGQDILIKVWPRVVAAVDDARLCFVGDGIRLEKLRGLARASSVAANIDILGFQSIQRLEQLWRRATALVLLGRLEGFGLVAVEAMRHSVPVLASTDDAVCEVNIDGVTGYNVGRNDEGAIVDRLVALLSDRDRARGLGAAGFQRWQTHFRLSVFRDRFLSAVEPWLRASIG